MTAFTKMHGNGNDFLVIENGDGELDTKALSALAKRLCDRKRALGADGLLVVEPSSVADFKMRLFNADGSEGEMCGNGARCIARYAKEKGIAQKEMVFETLAGIIRASVEGEEAVLDLGRIDLTGAVWDEPISVFGKDLRYSFLVAGVPHCIVFGEGWKNKAQKELFDIGSALRYDFKRFPSGTNVDFAELFEENRLYVVTYERGVEDLTESCGTGSVASAITAARLRGLSGPFEVQNPGGINRVLLDFSQDGTSVSAKLSGKTTLVAAGIFFD